MTTKNFVVKNGITTGSITLDASSGNISGTNLSVTGVSNLGAVGNVKVTGGSANYVITTDGTGNLSFTDPVATQSPAPMPTYIAVGNTVTISSNYQGIFGYPITVDGTIVVDGILVDVNDATVPAGNINFVQYNAGNVMGGDANFYYTAVNGTMTVKNETITGNSTIGNLVISTTANLGAVGNVKITGGSSGQVLSTDGTGVLSWVSAPAAVTATTVTANSQPNITSVGTLTSVSVSGNANIGNAINVTGNVVGTGAVNAFGDLVNNPTFSGLATRSLNLVGNSAVMRVARTTTTGNPAVELLGLDPTTGATNDWWDFFTASDTFVLRRRTVDPALILLSATATGVNFPTGNVSATGNITVANMFTAGNVTASQLISNVTTGTAPLTVTSTTRVGNLNVAYANVSDFISVAAGTGNNFIIFANAATGNITELTSTGLIANLSNNSITATTFVGALSGAATSATTAGTVTTAAQPNITSVGTLTSVSVSGNANIGNIGTAGLITATGNLNAGNLITAGIVSATGNITGGNLIINNVDASIGSVSTTAGWYYETSFSVSAQDTEPRGIFFKPDGTRMYVAGQAGDDIIQYDLATAWNVSTATYSNAFVVSSQGTTPYDVHFNSDGTIMYVLDGSNDDIDQYTLSSAWDIGSASFASIQFSVSGQESAPTGFWFRPDGTQLFVTGTTGDDVNEYNLGTAWNVSTASFVRVSSSLAAYESSPEGLAFSSDGSKMWIVGATYNRITQFDLSTPWNVSTLTYNSQLPIYGSGPYAVAGASGLYVNESAGVAYVSDYQNDRIFQYDTDTPTGQFYGPQWTTETDFNVGNNLSVNQSFFAGGTARIVGALTASTSVNSPTFATTSSSGTTSLITGTTTGTINFATGISTGTLNQMTAQTTGNFILGGTGATGNITIGLSTASQSINIGNGSTSSGNTKTINIGNNGVANSITNINIGTNTGNGNVTFSANTLVTIANTSGTALTVAGNITGGNVIGTLLTGTLSTAAQPNITSVGTLTGLGVNGTITGVNITANTGVFTGNGSALTALNASNVSSGTLAQARLANASVTLGSTALTLGSTVTTVAGLTSVTSTTFVGALTGAASSATTAGTVTTAAQPNITSVGTLTSVSVSGNAAAGNVTVTGYHFRSVATGISAAGSTQGTATAISKEINVVSTVASGAGVVLPTAVAGMAITITNTSANSLLVYPATSGIINSLSANAGYTQPAGATLQFVAPTTTQWYTIGASYA